MKPDVLPLRVVEQRHVGDFHAGEVLIAENLHADDPGVEGGVRLALGQDAERVAQAGGGHDVLRPAVGHQIGVRRAAGLDGDAAVAQVHRAADRGVALPHKDDNVRIGELDESGALRGVGDVGEGVGPAGLEILHHFRPGLGDEHHLEVHLAGDGVHDIDREAPGHALGVDEGHRLAVKVDADPERGRINGVERGNQSQARQSCSERRHDPI